MVSLWQEEYAEGDKVLEYLYSHCKKKIREVSGPLTNVTTEQKGQPRNPEEGRRTRFPPTALWCTWDLTQEPSPMMGSQLVIVNDKYILKTHKLPYASSNRNFVRTEARHSFLRHLIAICQKMLWWLYASIIVLPWGHTKPNVCNQRQIFQERSCVLPAICKH